jgi:hypothetical protein
MQFRNSIRQAARKLEDFSATKPERDLDVLAMIAELRSLIPQQHSSPQELDRMSSRLSQIASD